MPTNYDLVHQIKARLDLRDVVEQALGPGRVSGQSRRWPCPFHQGHNPTALMVTQGRFYCWSCEAQGDLLAWYMQWHGLDFKAALRQAAADAGLPLELDRPQPPRRLLASSPPRLPASAPPLAPPAADWQQAHHHYVMRCRAYLWNPANQVALEYLRRQRGLTDATIEQALLGYDPGRKLIVIPWYIERELWRVGGRALNPGGRKAPLFPGFKPALYRADRLDPARPAVLCEGEFDALAVAQAAGDLAAAVASGGVSGGRRLRWLAQLAQLPLVLVAFDHDPAGERAVAWWLDHLPNARRWRPVGAKDPNDMLVAGLCLRHWLAPALGHSAELTTTPGLDPPADAPPNPTPEPGWRRWLRGRQG